MRHRPKRTNANTADTHRKEKRSASESVSPPAENGEEESTKKARGRPRLDTTGQAASDVCDYLHYTRLHLL